MKENKTFPPNRIDLEEPGLTNQLPVFALQANFLGTNLMFVETGDANSAGSHSCMKAFSACDKKELLC